jgi:poly-beta-1,6-N-acetyl-D-glucosamine synthase
MLTFAIVCFWSSAAIVAYAYVVYPLLIALAARFRPWPSQYSEPRPTGCSVVLAVRNEQAHIGRRLAELTKLIDDVGTTAELIVISDGSTDETASLALSGSSENVIVVEWAENRGKAAALNHAVSLARHEVIVFADARQTWADDAIQELLICFRDPRVGAVSGKLALRTASGVLAGVGAYWKFEKWLRANEAHLHSQIGVTGAISAVRRTLFQPIPVGTILDDVYWPMQVILQGHRVIYAPQAMAFDDLPERAAVELRRKVRTLVGNFQLLSMCPHLLMPHRNLRLVAPWGLLLILLSSWLANTTFYQTVFWCSSTCLAVATLGLLTPWGAKHRLFSTAGSFLLLQIAAWLAFWYWILGRSQSVWTPSPPQTSATEPL